MMFKTNLMVTTIGLTGAGSYDKPVIESNVIESNRVLLSDITAITLTKGRMTTSRQSKPVPQLKCVGGSAQHKFQPHTVQCYNRGSDGHDSQWACKADMDIYYKFGALDVTCEGFDYPNDPYVLYGSCGLEYKIELTEEWYEKERKPNDGNGPTPQGHMDLVTALVFLVVIIIVLALIKHTFGFAPEVTFNENGSSNHNSQASSNLTHTSWGYGPTKRR